MVEPLLGTRPLLADCHPAAGVATLSARPAGPAGSAGITLADGLELDVDVADPATLVGLTLEWATDGAGGLEPPPQHRRALEVLLGGDRAAQLAASLHGRPDADGWVGCRLGDGAHLARGVAPGLHRAALAVAGAGTAGVPTAVRGIALAEAAAELAPVAERLPAVGAVVRDWLAGAADLVVETLAEGTFAVPEHAAAPVGRLLRRVARLAATPPLAGARFAALARELDEGAHRAPPPRRRPVGTLAATASSGSPIAPGGEITVDRDGLPGLVAGAVVTGRRCGTSEVEVRIARFGDRRDLWARALDRSDRTVVAMGPFRPEGDDAVALLLVPPDAMGRVALEVTERPGDEPASAALSTVTRAVQEGVAAARAERLGDRRAALGAWHRCAHAWAAAGDPARAEDARRLASQLRGPRSSWPERVVPPLVVDRLLAGLGP